MTPAKRNRPEVISGATYEVKTPCSVIYVTINEHDGPFEIFLTLGGKGQRFGCQASCTEAMVRGFTLALRCGATLEQVLKQISGNRCNRNPAWIDGKPIWSCADAVAAAIKMHLDIWDDEDEEEHDGAADQEEETETLQKAQGE